VEFAKSTSGPMGAGAAISSVAGDGPQSGPHRPEVTEMIVMLTSLVWVALEAWLLIRDATRGKGGTALDKGTRTIGQVVILAAAVGAAIAHGVLQHDAGWQFGSRGLTLAGLVIMWAGLGLRLRAVQVLGTSFRTTVEVDEGQRVVDHGPYRWIRHPSYTGILLIAAGLGLADGNWLSLALLVVLPLASLLPRIAVEEAALTRVLGRPYAEYCARTKRLVPGLW
jgi:protein-S-isoprenylcysteine O-methyltransferase Ste14